MSGGHCDDRANKYESHSSLCVSVVRVSFSLRSTFATAAPLQLDETTKDSKLTFAHNTQCPSFPVLPLPLSLPFCFHSMSSSSSSFALPLLFSFSFSLTMPRFLNAAAVLRVPTRSTTREKNCRLAIVLDIDAIQHSIEHSFATNWYLDLDLLYFLCARSYILYSAIVCSHTHINSVNVSVLPLEQDNWDKTWTRLSPPQHSFCTTILSYPLKVFVSKQEGRRHRSRPSSIEGEIVIILILIFWERVYCVCSSSARQIHEDSLCPR